MNTALVCESIGADNGLVRLNHHACSIRGETVEHAHVEMLPSTTSGSRSMHHCVHGNRRCLTQVSGKRGEGPNDLLLAASTIMLLSKSKQDRTCERGDQAGGLVDLSGEDVGQRSLRQSKQHSCLSQWRRGLRMDSKLDCTPRSTRCCTCV
eukprot:44798-Eustigmatos_ZCMA.PRE.1